MGRGQCQRACSEGRGRMEYFWPKPFLVEHVRTNTAGVWPQRAEQIVPLPV